MAKRVNGYTLHRRVMKALEPDGEPKNKEEAFKYVAWVEYLIANRNFDEQNVSDWEEEINEIKDQWGLWEVKKK